MAFVTSTSPTIMAHNDPYSFKADHMLLVTHTPASLMPGQESFAFVAKDLPSAWKELANRVQVNYSTDYATASVITVKTYMGGTVTLEKVDAF